MPDEFNLTLDLSPIFKMTQDLSKEINARLTVAAESLAKQTHAHVLEQANKRLHSRLEMFTDNFDLVELEKGVFSIIVYEKARWIEDGTEPHSMLDDLLASPKAKTSKDGHKYIVIPFKHNKGPTKQPPHQQEMWNSLKKELRRRKIKQGVEKNVDGSPKVGLLHKFDFMGPNRKHAGQGSEGPSGKGFEAHSRENHEAGPSGRPFLWGVRVYQRQKLVNGKMKVTRDIMTFRTASSSGPANAWFHPGNEPMHFLDDAYTWAKDRFDNNIAPEILLSLDNV